MLPATVSQLRQGVLAVSVLGELDLVPTDDGVLLTGTHLVEVEWSQCIAALGGHRPDSQVGRRRLARLLRVAGWLAAADSADIRPVGLPRTHVLHPGDGWAYDRVLGGVLDIGLGVVGLDPADPDLVLAVPVELSVQPAERRAWELVARERLAAMGQLAAQRSPSRRSDPLRPVGGCDVVTLLGSRTLRTALATAQGGMCAVTAPMLTRGWTDLRRIDPAFCVAAAAATDDVARGFDRPLLVTADEVSLARGGGTPASIELRDPAPATRWQDRTVLYR